MLWKELLDTRDILETIDRRRHYRSNLVSHSQRSCWYVGEA